MENFKPKSLDELNAAFAEQLRAKQKEYDVEIPEPKEETKELLSSDERLSPEQEEFYSESFDAQEDYAAEAEETEEYEPEDEVLEDTALEEPGTHEEDELFEAEKLSQEQTELFEAEQIPDFESSAQERKEETGEIESVQNDEYSEEEYGEPNPTGFFADLDSFAQDQEPNKTETQETASEEPAYEEPAYEEPAAEPKKEEAKQEPIARPFVVSVQEQKPQTQENVKFDFEREREYEEIKLHNRAAERKSKQSAAKVILNTLISVTIIVCLFVSAIVFAADMPERFIGNWGVMICDHNIEGSNVKKDMLMIVKKAKNAADNKIVGAYVDGKKVTVDFAKHLPDDADIFAIGVRGVPAAGRFIKAIRRNCVNCALVASAVLLVLVIVRVCLPERKNKAEDIPVNKKKSNKR